MQIPKNVVQAGDVDSCHKIYIEDYVHTYLSQCRDTGSSADFCLYGKTEKEGDVRYYFIYGAAKEGPGGRSQRDDILQNRAESVRRPMMIKKPGFFLKTAMQPLWKATLFFMNKMRTCSLT